MRAGAYFGILLLGPKRSQEAYAPDEVDAIRQLAHSLGAVLDVLSPKAGDNGMADALGALTAEIAALRHDLRTSDAGYVP